MNVETEQIGGCHSALRSQNSWPNRSYKRLEKLHGLKGLYWRMSKTKKSIRPTEKGWNAGRVGSMAEREWATTNNKAGLGGGG